MPNSNTPSAQPPTADRLPTVSYRDMVNEQFMRVWDRFDAVDKALIKADADLTAYKLTANEFRGTLSDQAQRLATKDELRKQDDSLEIQRLRIDKLETAAANMHGRVWMLAFVFAILQVVINFAAYSLKQGTSP